jgi:hypothetical protein
MRVGHNPAVFVEKVGQPAEITIAVLSCIPFISGYYEQSLEVLQTCLNSIHENTPEAHDLMVFDNHSCREVREYLKGAFEQGIIQSLVLSNKNIGKIGAWNFIFGAAQGEYVVFCDGDIGYRPGWLRASLELFETFPKVGMVTARPLRTSMQYSSATLEWASKLPGVLAEGQFLEWEDYWEHSSSVGISEKQGRINFPRRKDYRLVYKGKAALVGGTHFQFMARSELLKSIIPLPSEQPMRGERELEVKINAMGYLRLLTTKAFIWHMGNRPSLPGQAVAGAPRRKSMLKRLLHLPGIRHVLLWLNNQIFRLYFFNVE